MKNSPLPDPPGPPPPRTREDLADAGRRASARELADRLAHANPAFLEGALQNPALGEDLVVAGRYSGSGRGSIRVHGTRGHERQSFVFPAEFPRHGGQVEASYLWAQFRVLTLLDQLRAAPPHQQRTIKDEIVDLGLRFGIVTIRTSMRAIAYGQMEATTSPDERITNRILLEPYAD